MNELINVLINALYTLVVKSYQSLLVSSYKHGYRVGLIHIFLMG